MEVDRSQPFCGCVTPFLDQGILSCPSRPWSGRNPITLSQWVPGTRSLFDIQEAGIAGPQREKGKQKAAPSSTISDILRIDNLWQFENLRKLQLDNNIIERIEGLENLVHLVWLDLSFNNIEAIEGLDTLVNLEDLSLFNNRISKIDSLDALVKLQVLSLGNNQIGNMMNLIYLRKFKCLRTLNLSGNPIAEAEDYKMFIYAYLPDLVYLDFRRIDDHAASLSLSVSQLCETSLQEPKFHRAVKGVFPCPHLGREEAVPSC
uniref:Dynein regulatory complex subunit 3 n=1 Tax=Spermophilus dauricus TaxID=99837 RepID=A0A8C9QRN9_SPEDA